jgi:hypothetical protein
VVFEGEVVEGVVGSGDVDLERGWGCGEGLEGALVAWPGAEERAGAVEEAETSRG